MNLFFYTVDIYIDKIDRIKPIKEWLKYKWIYLNTWLNPKIYYCECGHEFEVRKFEYSYKCYEECPKCACDWSVTKETLEGREIQKQRDRQDQRHGAYSDTVQAHYNHGLGEYVDSKSQMKALAKDKGLAWIGDDKVPQKQAKPEPKVDWNRVAYDLDKGGAHD